MTKTELSNQNHIFKNVYSLFSYVSSHYLNNFMVILMVILEAMLFKSTIEWKQLIQLSNKNKQHNKEKMGRRLK